MNTFHCLLILLGALKGTRAQFGFDDYPKARSFSEPIKKHSDSFDPRSQTHPGCSSSSKTSSKATCAMSAEELGSGNLVAGTLPRSDDHLPKWINLELAQKGQRLYDRYFGASLLSFLFRTVSFMAIPHIGKTVLYTGNSDTVEKFAKRYTATAAHFALWPRNIFGEDTANVVRSIENIRKRHKQVVQRVNHEREESGPELGLDIRYANYSLKFSDFWNALKKDLEISNIPAKFRKFPKSYTSTVDRALPINQFLLSMAQFTQASPVAGFPENALVHDLTDQDIIAANHYYAVIGYALGIDDIYNICLQPNLAKQKKFYKDLMQHYFIPALFNLTMYSKILMEIFADSLSGQVLPASFKTSGADKSPMITMEAVIMRILRDYVQIPTDNLDAVASMETKAFLTFYENIFKPSSFMPGFHDVLTAAANAVMKAKGFLTFGDDYATDESIAENVFLEH